MGLVALDVALLLPDDVAMRAGTLSEALGGDNRERLKLDSEHLPHVTLTQQFIRAEEVDVALSHLDPVIARHRPLRLRVSGGGRGNSAVWMAIDRSPEIDALHEQLMDALHGFERQAGTTTAFHEEDARAADVIWVAGYRLKSAFGWFTPHVTLGHAPNAPHIQPFEFVASTVAACHLGRFCACRRVLRQWSL